MGSRTHSLRECTAAISEVCYCTKYLNLFGLNYCCTENSSTVFVVVGNSYKISCKELVLYLYWSTRNDWAFAKIPPKLVVLKRSVGYSELTVGSCLLIYPTS